MLDKPENGKRQELVVVVRRVFDAPVEQVWRALTDSELVMRWWGPNYFSSPFARIDFREGGKALVCMRSPQGQDTYSIWEYRKIVPMERIEYIFNLSDQEGNKEDPVKMGLPPDFPRDAPHVVTLKAAGNKTEMTFTEYGYASDQMFKLATMGLEQCLDKMAAIFAQARAKTRNV